MTDLTDGQRSTRSATSTAGSTSDRDARAHPPTCGAAASAAAGRLPRRLHRPRARGARVIEALIALSATIRCRHGSCSATTTATSAPISTIRFDRTYHWLHENMGGNATLASYGVPGANWDWPEATRDAFAHAFPAEHMGFIDACERMIPIGGYLFVHADPARRGARQPGRRRPDLDPRAVPELAGGLRLQGGARPHRRAGSRAPRQSDRRRHRRGPSGVLSTVVLGGRSPGC